jgi:hypothetical protein
MEKYNSISMKLLETLDKLMEKSQNQKEFV